MAASAEQDTEWRLLYAKLSGLLESAGDPDPYGNGDYWLVDDDWGSKQHKICIFRIESVSSTLIEAIQKILQPFGPDWEVLIALEIQDKRYTGALRASLSRRKLCVKTGIVGYSGSSSAMSTRNGAVRSNSALVCDACESALLRRASYSAPQRGR
jgi:hypothetical protein